MGVQALGTEQRVGQLSSWGAHGTIQAENVAKEVVSKNLPSPASRYLLAQHYPHNSFRKACKAASQPQVEL